MAPQKVEATYGNDPANSTTDQVRFLVGDTDPSKAYLSDEEIEFLVSDAGSATKAAPRAARAIAARCSRDVTYSTGEASKNLSDLVKHYRDLAKELEARLDLGGLTVYAGGISADEWPTDAEDTDLVQTEVEVGQHDNSLAANSPTRRLGRDC